MSLKLGIGLLYGVNTDRLINSPSVDAFTVAIRLYSHT